MAEKQRMILVKLMGGLGNQMFQYAAGRRLAHVRKTELKLDLSWFSSSTASDTRRKYELKIHPIKADIATAREAKSFVQGDFFSKTTFFLSAFKLTTPRVYIREKGLTFDESILTLPDDVYLEGYWQSQKYFLDIANIIREEFTVKVSPTLYNLKLAESIKNTEAVSLHVRRGDYVSNPATNQFHGTCSLDYYRAAINIISSRVKNPRFFVFSDDLEWVKANLVIDKNAVYVENNCDMAYEDIRLMTYCKHFIIANSSFSWWGAWLSRNPNKLVIAPRRWFNREDIDTGDLVPESWLRI